MLGGWWNTILYDMKYVWVDWQEPSDINVHASQLGAARISMKVSCSCKAACCKSIELKSKQIY